ncbi:MAG: PilN domain-containing protein [Deltaproteobacteria bacterium]|nr:PilN domain-containing protein [Deltaproteobacteria bacterium]
MAQINLYKKATSKRNFLKITLILLLLIIEVFLFSSLSQTHQSQLKELLSRKQTIEENKKKLTENIAALKNEIQNLRIKSTPGSEAALFAPSSIDVLDILSIIAESLPSKTWLTSMKFQNSDFFIEGTTLDGSIVSNYLEVLDQSKKFKKVELLYLKKEKKTYLKNFSIKCKVLQNLS